MHIAIYPDIDMLSHEAAKQVVNVAQESISTHGRFTFALSGGNTPKKLYGLLATEP
jgi:6-phosphogluconolactonase